MAAHLPLQTVPERQPWMGLPLCDALSAHELAEIATRLRPVTYAAGDEIVTQGAPGDVLFIMETGRVRVTMSSNGDDAFETTLVAPAIFGEMALITEMDRTASVVAEEATECLMLSRVDYEDLASEYPGIGHFLTRIVGERLLEANAIRQVGKYTVKGKLGSGAVSMVFDAEHPDLGQEVALKMLSHGLVYQKGFAERFREEARVVARLEHDHIVRVLDTEQAYGTHFIVMEKVRGTLLEDLIQSETRLSWGAIRRILKEICLALEYSHEKGLLHRDIKPSNIFLTEDLRAKVVDFGIAISTQDTTAQDGMVIGTPYYMSPEQIRGEPLDGRTDLYALGILAFELITLTIPFHGDTLDELLHAHLEEPFPEAEEWAEDVPHDLVEFVLYATAKDREERFPSCGHGARFLQTASELPWVNRLELSTVAITYHPVRRAFVADALDALHEQLADVAGVSLLYGHQESVVEDEDDVEL